MERDHFILVGNSAIEAFQNLGYADEGITFSLIREEGSQLIDILRERIETPKRRSRVQVKEMIHRSTPAVLISDTFGDALWTLIKEIRALDPWLLVAVACTADLAVEQLKAWKWDMVLRGAVGVSLRDRDDFAEFIDTCHKTFIVLNKGHGPVDNHPMSLPEDFNEVCTTTPVKNQQRVWLIRHGQSLANAYGSVSFHEDTFRDCSLSKKGNEEARLMREKVGPLSVPLVVCSPLRRAIQTATHIFGNRDVPLVAMPYVTEFWADMPESQGRELEEIISDPALTSCEGFDRISFGYVWSGWAKLAHDEQRLQLFLEWVKLLPVQDIAVVAHYGFIQFLSEDCGFRSLHIPNCSVTILDVEKSKF